MDKEMEESLERLYHRIYQHMIEKDVHSLGEMLDDRFVLTHMTGLRQSKNDFLRSIKEGTLNYYSESASKISFDDEGSLVYLTGCSHVEAAVFGGGRYKWPLCLKLRLHHNDGKWKISEIIASMF